MDLELEESSREITFLEEENKNDGLKRIDRN